MGLFLNLGSGQRRFTGWVNVDSQSVPPDRVPDQVADIRSLPYPTGTADMVCLHHVLEHFHLQDGATVLKESHRVLKSCGSLLIFIPNIRVLAQRWLMGQVDDYTMFVNCMGAYMGDEADFHRWHYTMESLERTLREAGKWSCIKPFNWRPIEGADIARDFWILGIEAVK